MHGATKNVDAASEVFAVQRFIGIVAAICVANQDDGRRNTRPDEHCRVMSDGGHAARGDAKLTCSVFDQPDQRRVQGAVACRPPGPARR